MKLSKKKVQVNTQGNMNGTWQITINGINDCDLENVENEVLKIFNIKKTNKNLQVSKTFSTFALNNKKIN